MQSQLTVRLSDDLAEGISRHAKRLRLKRSDIVRMALENFLSGVQKEETSPYDRVSNLIGAVKTGMPDLGQSHREYLIRRIRKNA
ncbi:MAG: ribbon-helix-helix domain-containing protein [Thermodesulfovibrionales bacterium]|nr:ribbon-helix-helix domain-containing protein [Thermodesulfovibrionales bacterium]